MVGQWKSRYRVLLYLSLLNVYFVATYLPRYFFAILGERATSVQLTLHGPRSIVHPVPPLLNKRIHQMKGIWTLEHLHLENYVYI